VSAFDHNRIGQLRIEKERALARIDALIEAGDNYIAVPSAANRRAWEQAKTYDGAPHANGSRLTRIQRNHGTKP